MIFYVRNKETGDNLLDIEVYVKSDVDYCYAELSSTLLPKEFGRMVIKMVREEVDPEPFINKIDKLSEIRGEWFEKERHVYRASKGIKISEPDGDGEKDACCEMVNKLLNEFVSEFNQYKVVTD